MGKKKLTGIKWQKIRGKAGKCPLAGLTYEQRSLCHGGQFFVGGTTKSRLFVWGDGGWGELTSRKVDKVAFDGNRTELLSGLVSDGETLYAIGNHGEVLSWEGKRWSVQHASDHKVFKKAWDGALLCHDEGNKRIVVWGGRSTETYKPGNDSFIFDIEKGKWRKLKRGLKPETDFWVDVNFLMFYDTKKKCVVRIGHKQFWILEGDVWTPKKSVNFQPHCDNRDRAVAHDPISGETLIIDFSSGNIIRFDVKGCSLIYTVELPPIKKFSGNKGLEARAYEHTWAFDPTTRALHIQNVDENSERFSLDLSAAFEFAAK